MEKTAQITEILRELRQRLNSLYGENLRQLILYGSHARGDADEGSDIDLLIVLEVLDDPEAELSRIDPLASELCLKYDVLLTFDVISARDYPDWNTPLLLNIRREGVPV
ncbi:MAG: nucleotidyltransferase domain-containing protein [bacterium]|nr:nucleotidyltransferase domain-containing protein [bacterium]